jgi:hypothetical protein
LDNKIEDGIHPLERLERIAVALEHIAKDLNKIANPPLTVDKDGNVSVLR